MKLTSWIFYVCIFINTVARALTPEPCHLCSSRMPSLVKWNYVLSETPKLTSEAIVYDIDGFDNSAKTVKKIHDKGGIAICYLNAGCYENWREDARAFPKELIGQTNGWEGERWLDIRQTNVLLPIMQERIKLCQSKGFDAIEFDNVDGYSMQTGFKITAEDQAHYNALLANMAHKANLAVGLKNDIEQIERLVPFFDFAINEQCFQYEECEKYKPFLNANKAVLNVEYSLNPSDFCPKAISLHINSIKKKKRLNENVVFCSP